MSFSSLSGVEVGSLKDLSEGLLLLTFLKVCLYSFPGRGETERALAVGLIIIITIICLFFIIVKSNSLCVRVLVSPVVCLGRLLSFKICYDMMYSIIY